MLSPNASSILPRLTAWRPVKESEMLKSQKHFLILFTWFTVYDIITFSAYLRNLHTWVREYDVMYDFNREKGFSMRLR